MVSLTNGETDSSKITDSSQNNKEPQMSMLKANRETATVASDDPQTLVIASLRSQISDLFSQVSQLNNKLVQSYDRVSDLEDELHISSSKLRASSIQVSQLELERAQHLAALNTGLLVERENVTAELTRLMEKATEEAARRGQAESARENIEKDLDDLSANLFQQANSMVADARWKSSLSERKVDEAELALKGAEEAVSSMQMQMQLLREEKEKSDIEIAQLKETMGKGKWVQKAPAVPSSYKLLSLHTPYEEFVLFVAHLRSIRPAAPHPPALPTMLSLPFLARLQAEDCEPTIRLDFAPSLNWLSRRSMVSAIYTGQLTIEPVASASLLLESSFSSVPTSMIPALTNSNISCALCGTVIYSPPSASPVPPPSHPSLRSISGHSMANSWSSTIFKNTLSTSATPSPPTSPIHSQPPLGSIHNGTTTPLQQIYVFRINQPTIVAGQTQQRPTSYPLCPSGWCLTRLRSTCSLWAFVRAGIVDKIWEEEVSVIQVTPQKEKAPPLPPRRRTKINMGSIWGMASSALGKERSSSKDSDTGSEKDLPSAPDAKAKTLPLLKTGNLPPPLPKRSVERNSAIQSRNSSPIMFSSGGSNSLDGVSEEGQTNTHSSTVSSPPTSAHRNSSEQSEKGPAKKENISVTASNMSLHPSGSDETQEEFTTPTDDLSANPVDTTAITSSAIIPSTVPLPESRPESPNNLEVKSSNAIERTDSVTSSETNYHSIEEEKTSTSNQVAPPPRLPPRAPARRVAPPPPSTLNGNQTDLSPTPLTDDSLSPEHISENHTEKTPTEATPAVELLPNETPPPTGDIKTSLNGDSHASTQEQKIGELSSPPTPSTIYTILPEKAESISAPSITYDIVKNVDTSADDLSTAGSFVGDVTWEERTWKEIVRLRENMFWARVGVLR